MRITFYRNCIITNSYGEVFDVFKKNAEGKSAFERYLESLEQATIDVPTVYYTNTGRFSMDYQYTNNIYDYNYLKIEENSRTSNDVPYNLVRYCFIDNITIINGEAVISYSEDVWHSYIKDSHIRNSLLTRKYILDFYNTNSSKHTPIKNYKLPIDYQYSGEPEITKFESPSPDRERYCALVVEYQNYTLGEKGEVTFRELGIGAICFNKEKHGDYYQYDIRWPLKYINKGVIRDIIIASSSPNAFNGNNNFDITNIYLLPYEITNFSPDTLFTTDIASDEIKLTNPVGHVLPLMSVENIFINGQIHNDYLIGDKYLIKKYQLPSKSLVHNKNITIGTFSSQFPVNINSESSNEIELYYAIDNFHLSLLIGSNNNYFDITKDFIVDYPISVDTADVTQLKQLSKEYAIMNNGINIASSVISGTSMGIMGLLMMGAGNLGYGTLTASSGVGATSTGIARGITNNDLLNEEMFTSSKSKNSLYNLAVLNAIYGVCYMTGKHELNTYEVVSSLSNEGYICSLYVNDILPKNNELTNNTFDVIKFDSINLYGKFPQNIANALKSILLNGVKIWYTENV